MRFRMNCLLSVYALREIVVKWCRRLKKIKENEENRQFLLFFCFTRSTTAIGIDLCDFSLLMLMEFYCLIAKCFWNHWNHASKNKWREGNDSVRQERRKIAEIFVLPYATTFCLTSTDISKEKTLPSPRLFVLLLLLKCLRGDANSNLHELLNNENETFIH